MTAPLDCNQKIYKLQIAIYDDGVEQNEGEKVGKE